MAKPAYATSGPKVLFDEAHNNFHTTGGRYRPFAELIARDGYRVTPNRRAFTPETLAGYDVLVVSNALGPEPHLEAPAFSAAEVDVVRAWVEAGGALLLIADHAPMGAANSALGRRFGIEMMNAFTVDAQHFDVASKNRGFIVYTRASGRLVDCAITRGRDATERVSTVIAFTGQSLKGPPDGVAFLKLADSAEDRLPDGRTVSAAGRAQAIALTVGRGRALFLGEAAMLTAQIAGPDRAPFGMNRPGIDNRQLALNIMHWLSGALR